ncbi:MAG: hypothetical protein NTW86_19535 [Candidatus Sumerlaeota bacterium]|nr:hypothetical protein [Candidatus Sumerlaeota bacterium]
MPDPSDRPTKTLLRAGKVGRIRSPIPPPEDHGPDDLLFDVAADPSPLDPRLRIDAPPDAPPLDRPR